MKYLLNVSSSLILRVGSILLLSWIFLTASPVAHGLAAEPLQQIKKSVQEILDTISSPGYSEEVNKESNRRKVFAIVEQQFDFTEMSQRTMAADWKRITGEQQNTFVGLFSQLLQKTYIAKLEKYSGEKVEFKDQEVRGDKAVVQTYVLKDGVEIPLIYRMKKQGDEWRVYDVVIEGVSLVSNYRGQFTGILRKEKIDGLLRKLEEKISSLDDATGG